MQLANNVKSPESLIGASIDTQVDDLKPIGSPYRLTYAVFAASPGRGPLRPLGA